MRITTANGALFGIETDETVSNPTWKIGGVVNSGAAEPLALYQVGSEILRIDSGGRLLIGASSSRDNDVYLQLEGVGYQSATMQITRNSNNADGGGIYIAKTRGTADGQSTIVQDDDELGYINFRGADGTDANTNAATIQAFCDGTPGSNDMPGRLVFSTTADGASSSTERLRIASNGQVRIGDGAASDYSISNDVNAVLQLTAASTPKLVLIRNDTSISNGDHLGIIDFHSRDGGPVRCARIAAVASGSHSSSDNPTDIVFRNCPDNSGSDVERFRIRDNGLVQFDSGFGSYSSLSCGVTLLSSVILSSP